MVVPQNLRIPISPRANRFVHAGAAALLAVGLGLCAIVEPHPSGAGTHTQLGLPRCLVCQITGLERCPSCGLTTGFAYLVRGQLGRAVAVHPAAPIVFFVWCAILLYCTAVAILGVDWLTQEILLLCSLSTLGLVIWLWALSRQVLGC